MLAKSMNDFSKNKYKMIKDVPLFVCTSINNIDYIYKKKIKKNDAKTVRTNEMMMRFILLNDKIKCAYHVLDYV